MTELDFAKIYAAEHTNLQRNITKILIKGKKRPDQEYYLQDVMDCTQEAFMALWKKRDSLIGDARDYLYRVARNQAHRLRELADRHDYLDDMVTIDMAEYRQAAL